MRDFISVGLANKGDIHIEARKNDGGIEIDLKSSVGKLYGESIEQQFITGLSKFGFDGLSLTIIDDGALPHVIDARIEALARHLGKSSESQSCSRQPKSKNRPRRSRLYMPGNNPYLVTNAFLFGSDVIILDLEDSVPPSEKFDTRILVKHMLRNTNFGNSESAVRINPLWTPFGEKDLEEVIVACPDIIFIPKAESREDILNVEEIVNGVVHDHRIDHTVHFFPIIESAAGVEHAYEIATASENIVAMAFGAEDYTKDMGIERTRDGSETWYARSVVVNAAKAARIQASDTVFSDLEDMEGFIANARESKMMGFDGKGLIHPSQIEPLHKIYEPTKSEIDYALKVVNAMKDAEKIGSGVISIGRKMIDPPVVERAKRVVATARRLGLCE